MRGLWGLVFAALVALQPVAGAAPHTSGAPDAICAVPASPSLRQRAVAQRCTEAGDAARPMLAHLLREHPAAAENLLLTSDARRDDLQQATRVLTDLYRRFGDDVDRLEDLAVAIALVHDSAGPLTRSVNGVRTRSPKAHEIFAFFRDRMKRTGARPTLAPELLAYVVDPNVDTGQMTWAAREYATADDSMSLYHQVPYDRELFRTGQKPAIASHSYTLRNVRTYGGVCADRAFFATNVSKAMGVPSVVVRGVRSDVTHAWAAQLDIETGAWREFGRSSKYKPIAGRIISPQTRGEMNEDELRMLGGLTKITARNRLDALAMAHVARAEGDGALPLIRAALALNPSCLPAWRELQRSASILQATDLAQWRLDVTRLCAAQKQFATRMLLEMAGAIRDAAQRQAEYEQLYALTGRNDDLACEVRFRQAVDLSMSGKAQEAIDLCRVAAVKHWRSGDGTLLLATTAREIAVRCEKRDALLGLYAEVFAGFTAPQTQAARFTRHTAWRLLGEDYARSLQEKGRDSEAREILEKIGAPAGT